MNQAKLTKLLVYKHRARSGEVHIQQVKRSSYTKSKAAEYKKKLQKNVVIQKWGTSISGQMMEMSLKDQGSSIGLG